MDHWVPVKDAQWGTRTHDLWLRNQESKPQRYPDPIYLAETESQEFHECSLIYVNCSIKQEDENSFSELFLSYKEASPYCISLLELSSCGLGLEFTRQWKSTFKIMLQIAHLLLAAAYFGHHQQSTLGHFCFVERWRGKHRLTPMLRVRGWGGWGRQHEVINKHVFVLIPVNDFFLVNYRNLQPFM